MRGLWIPVLFLGGCVDGSADDPGRGASGDAARVADTAPDSVVVVDAAEPPPDTTMSAADTTMSAPDTAACKMDCKGNECGKIPDRCGGFKDCGDCGEPGVWCEVMTTPLHREAVRAAIERVKVTNPEYFDFTDSLGGESVKVVDPMNYRIKVVAEVNTKPAKVCIGDPNDGREIRVRASTSMSAENYLTVTSGGVLDRALLAAVPVIATTRESRRIPSATTLRDRSRLSQCSASKRRPACRSSMTSIRTL